MLHILKKCKRANINNLLRPCEPKIEESFYKEIEKDYKLDEIYENLMKRNTQFVIWANYDMKSDNNMYISKQNEFTCTGNSRTSTKRISAVRIRV